ncbi:DUF7064 domain-containing protein [Sphingomonas sp.]|uniref:DUF7065 domain-containing protein n=1 Tax=Sphingomonas sp. TaxID=28214 RepID=UPI003AFF617C
MTSITDIDDHNHEPEDGASVDWQESFCLAWYDPVQRIGGFQHTGMQRVRGIADAWCWITHEGRAVEKYHNNKLPLPEADYSDITIGPIQLRSEQPLTHRRLMVEHGRVRADLRYAARGETVGLSYDVGGSSMGRGHWENFGRVAGTVTIDGTDYAIDAAAFQDRSWGTRDWGSILTYRWNWATFGDDLIFSIYRVVGRDGTQAMGHVFDRGTWHQVRSVDFAIEMASDGVSPLGSIATVWLDDGTGYRLRGRCDGSSVQTQRDGYMMCNACTNYELGGRLGTGFIEVSELKQPTSPEIARQLAEAAH